MARALPKNKAIELMAEARLMDLREALDLNLINYIYESDGYWDKVLEYAKSFCPPNSAWRARLAAWSAQIAMRRPGYRSPRHWPSSANCSPFASRARMRRKASPPIGKNARQSSRRATNHCPHADPHTQWGGGSARSSWSAAYRLPAKLRHTGCDPRHRHYLHGRADDLPGGAVTNTAAPRLSSRGQRG